MKLTLEQYSNVETAASFCDTLIITGNSFRRIVFLTIIFYQIRAFLFSYAKTFLPYSIVKVLLCMSFPGLD